MPARGAKRRPSVEPAAHREDLSVLCNLLLLPALQTIFRVTDTKRSWVLSFMLSWEGGMGYRDFYSFAKLLGASLPAPSWGSRGLDGESHLWKAIIHDSKFGPGQDMWRQLCSTHPLLTVYLLKVRVNPSPLPTSHPALAH